MGRCRARARPTPTAGSRSGAAGASDQEFLSGRTLNNAGAATLAGSNTTGYGLYLAAGATFDNKPGASFAFTTDAVDSRARRHPGTAAPSSTRGR